jgi:hypothetical protein
MSSAVITSKDIGCAPLRVVTGRRSIRVPDTAPRHGIDVELLRQLRRDIVVDVATHSHSGSGAR